MITWRAPPVALCVHSSPNYFPPRRREKHVNLGRLPRDLSYPVARIAAFARRCITRANSCDREREEEKEKRRKRETEGYTERDGRGKEGKKKRKKKEESKRRLKRRVDRKRLVKARRDPVNRARSLSQRRRLPPRRKAVEN